MLENIDFSLTFLSFILLVCGSRAGLGQVGGKGRLNMLVFLRSSGFVCPKSYIYLCKTWKLSKNNEHYDDYGFDEEAEEP